MKCKYCGNEMAIDDVDFNFPGNKNNYWICYGCGAGAFEKIRYNRSIRIDWEKGESYDEKTK